MQNIDSEPCLCGDPDCGRCFYRAPAEQDPDESYDAERQRELDDNRE